MLAILLLEVGRPVSTARLADLVWAGAPPDSARDVIQTYISRVRARLRDAGSAESGVHLSRQQGGYRLDADSAGIDAHVFTRLCEQAQRCDVPAERARLLRTALGLWRGPALADIGADAIRDRLGARLEEARRTALDLRIGADLEDGRHVRLIGELAELHAGSPLDERLAGHLMLALYRDGRRAEALQVFNKVRARIQEELGLDPGAEIWQLHTAILRADAALDHPDAQVRHTTPPVVQPERRWTSPAQLPAGIPDFIGREAEIAQLDELLSNSDSEAPTTLIISAIAGAGGVGKTALAVKWAHRIAARVFTDGQLFVDLRGFGGGSPLRPIEALSGFLRALGVSGEHIPNNVDEAAALFRSRLVGRRVLIVLDNAASPAQVRPLLPGDSGCVVIVTSRDRLSSLTVTNGARRLPIDLLSKHEAVALLRQILGPDLVDADPASIEHLARACGYLPLALRIAATQIELRSDQNIAGYLSEMDAVGTLDTLTIEDDELATVRATFTASYLRLAKEERRLFRLISLIPGREVTAPVAAALFGTTIDQAASLLDRLADIHLLGQSAPGRYALHDLLQTYALERLHDEDDETRRTEAVDRLLSWYLHTADAAARLLYTHMVRLSLPAVQPGISPLVFDNHTSALTWLETERSSLLAAIAYAALPNPRSESWLLTDTLRGYFWQSSHTSDWLTAADTSLQAAAQAGDVRAQAALHMSIALANQAQERYEVARDRYKVAADLADRAGWREGHAAIVGNLGIVYKNTGDLRAAAECHVQALDLHRECDYRAGQANALTNLASVRHDMGELQHARDTYVDALALHREAGSRIGELIALNNLGVLDHRLGRLASARKMLTEALALQPEVGKRYAEANTLHSLAAIDHEAGNHTLALYTAQTALTLARDVDERATEGQILSLLGTIYTTLGQHDEAVDHHRRALAILRDGGSRQLQTHTLTGLAEALAARAAEGDRVEAVTAASEALGMAQTAGYVVEEGNAFTILGRAYFAARDHVKAARDRQTGHRAAQTDRASARRSTCTAPTRRLRRSRRRPPRGPEALAGSPGDLRRHQPTGGRPDTTADVGIIELTSMAPVGTAPLAARAWSTASNRRGRADRLPPEDPLPTPLRGRGWRSVVSRKCIKSLAADQIHTELGYVYITSNRNIAIKLADLRAGVPNIDGPQIGAEKTGDVPQSLTFPFQPAPALQPCTETDWKSFSYLDCLASRS
ncbi:DNA-binding SARP family transcriptional activator/tetratricopeptide (TPR) repeat protein [Allocatelliglobosispora scoriae]|uniref:DNA-binding SARP family transcriptional activator/tetratricopeptide (TPR) repeat protein n=1 Tax=Allocatelliglobosispora scoriae TaxID=643052 RepID=A0A841BHI3_9ACTN|nr:DNA-binding SARP family transcriptional activator/tetratricopeptide (TPR) repeat protein [Allocatelliglobosispora scoriae]